MIALCQERLLKFCYNGNLTSHFLLSIEALIPETADSITRRLHEKHISGQANPFLVSG